MPILPLIDLADQLTWPPSTNKLAYKSSQWVFYGDCGQPQGPRTARGLSTTRFWPVWNCLGGQVAAPGFPPASAPPQIILQTDPWWTVILGQDYVEASPGNWRWTNRQWFDWNTTTVGARPTPFINRIPAPAIGLAPDPLPSLLPDAVAPGSWTNPAAVPWELLPDWNPGEWPQSTQRGPQPDTPVANFPRLPEFPVVEISPNGDVQVRPNPTPTRRRPPDRGEKEKKLRMGRGGALALVGLITEGMDLVGALHEALPDKHRTRRATPLERMRDIYDHYGDIDVFEALGNIGWEMAEDMFIGRLSRGAGQLARLTDRPVGPLAGPADNQPDRPESEADRRARERAQHFRWLASLEPWERAAHRRLERQQRRSTRARKRGGSNRANTGPLRRVKLRDGRSVYTSR